MTLAPGDRIVPLDGDDAAFGSSADADAAFLRLREVLGAPDRSGWRRWLEPLRASKRPVAETTELPADREEPDARRAPRLAAFLALPLLGAAVVLLASIARSPESAAPPPAAVPSAPSMPIDTAAPGAAANPPTTRSVPQRVWPSEPVAIDGREVRIGTAHWAVGEPGDLVVVGDWDCDLQPTPAVLRPGSGFFVFDTWAPAGGEVQARKVADSSTAVTVTAAGCGVAVLQAPDGSERRLDLTKPTP